MADDQPAQSVLIFYSKISKKFLNLLATLQVYLEISGQAIAHRFERCAALTYHKVFLLKRKRMNVDTPRVVQPQAQQGRSRLDTIRPSVCALLNCSNMSLTIILYTFTRVFDHQKNCSFSTAQSYSSLPDKQQSY